MPPGTEESAGAAGPATLADWRLPHRSVASFRRVREIVPSADIPAGAPAGLERGAMRGVAAIPVPDGAGESPFGRFLAEMRATALVCLRGGRIVGEWYGHGYDGLSPHILFSISKSLTGLVAGILAGRGLLDPEAPVTDYVPEAGGAYGDATVRHLLDMTVSTPFDESYLDAAGDYVRYRIATAWNPPDPAIGQEPGLHAFLTAMPRGEAPHGRRFHYVSPNSDMLGWVVERAGGAPFARLFSELLWTPMGAEAAAYVTTDGKGAQRTAGGICARPRDLARVGEMVRLAGMGPRGPVVPAEWIADMADGGDPAPWRLGDMLELYPDGGYRSKWYRTGMRAGGLAAMGIHGQWLWIDPEREVVIALTSAQAEPVSDPRDLRLIPALDALAGALAPPVA